MENDQSQLAQINEILGYIKQKNVKLKHIIMKIIFFLL